MVLGTWACLGVLSVMGVVLGWVGVLGCTWSKETDLERFDPAGGQWSLARMREEMLLWGQEAARQIVVPGLGLSREGEV